MTQKTQVLTNRTCVPENLPGNCSGSSNKGARVQAYFDHALRRRRGIFTLALASITFPPFRWCRAKGIVGADTADVRNNRYFVILGLGGGAALGAVGEITNVTQVFQPSGRCSAANSL